MDGRTPLHVAAMHDALKVAQWLIAEGVEARRAACPPAAPASGVSRAQQRAPHEKNVLHR